MSDRPEPSDSSTTSNPSTTSNLSTTSDPDRLAEQLAAIERRLTGDGSVADLEDSAELATRVDELEATIADLEATLEEVEAGLQAVRGYAGGVRAVNREVERRADLALARTDRIERRLDSENETPPSGDEDLEHQPTSVPTGDAIEAAIPDRGPNSDDVAGRPKDDVAGRTEDDVDGAEDVLARLREAL